MSRSVEYIVHTPDGQVENITNLRAYCRDHELNYQSMSAVMNPNTNSKSHKGYTLIRKYDSIIYTISIDGDDFVGEFKDIDDTVSKYIEDYGVDKPIRIGEIHDKPYNASDFLDISKVLQIIVDKYNDFKLKNEDLKTWATYGAMFINRDWLSKLSKKDVDSLSSSISKTIDNWAKRTNNQPNFVKVDNVKDYLMIEEN